MYELLIKLENSLEYKKYTIQDLEEMKRILEGLKTQEVRLKKISSK